MSEKLAQLQKMLQGEGLDKLRFSEKKQIPVGQLNTSATLTEKGQLMFIYSLQGNREPTVYYYDTQLWRGDSGGDAPTITGISADGKTVSLNIPNYQTTYFLVNFVTD